MYCCTTVDHEFDSPVGVEACGCDWGNCSSKFYCGNCLRWCCRHLWWLLILVVCRLLLLVVLPLLVIWEPLFLVVPLFLFCPWLLVVWLLLVVLVCAFIHVCDVVDCHSATFVTCSFSFAFVHCCTLPLWWSFSFALSFVLHCSLEGVAMSNRCWTFAFVSLLAVSCVSFSFVVPLCLSFSFVVLSFTLVVVLSFPLYVAPMSMGCASFVLLFIACCSACILENAIDALWYSRMSSRMSAYRCMAPARSCRYCCSGPLVSLSSIAILMLSGIGAWLSLSYLAISNSHIVKDSSNLFSLNCGFKSFVRYPTLRVRSGMEKRLCSSPCLETNCL